MNASLEQVLTIQPAAPQSFVIQIAQPLVEFFPFLKDGFVAGHGRLQE
jgi:hypothetical protein